MAIYTMSVAQCHRNNGWFFYMVWWPPAHCTTIPKAVGEVITPIFDRLGDKSLLERCLKENTKHLESL